MGQHEKPGGAAMPPADAMPAGDAMRVGGFAEAIKACAATAGDRSGSTQKPARDEIDELRRMLLIRRFEEKAGQLYAFGDIGGYCHLSIGQEAVAVGLALAAAPGDQLVTGHRCHGHLLARGGDPRRIMAELAGRGSGICGGKGGSMHLYAPDAGYYGGQGIVGAAASIGAGLAFANSYRGEASVAWCSIGDRAVDQGQVSEALDMAARWRLPLVVVIENNAAEGEGAADRPLWRRGEAFGIAGEAVDGICVAAVRNAALGAAAHARAGHGPRLIEARTACFRGHAEAEDAALPPAELQARREQEDPVERARRSLAASGLLSRDQFRAIDDEIRELVSAAADFAQADAEPDPTQLHNDVVAHG